MGAPSDSAAKLPAKAPPSGEPRAALSLSELVELLVRAKVLAPAHGKDIEARATMLRSRVLKDRVGSVRSQAAARYDVSAAEIVAAAGMPHAQKEHRKIDEDAIAQAIAADTGLRHVKIDPLKLDNALISKTFSRPFVRRHVVIPVALESEGLVIAVADPFDTTLRETLQDVLRKPFVYAITSKRDILAVSDRVFGLRSSIKQAVSELGDQSPTQALVQLVQLRSNEELATSNDEHVVAAVDFLLNYAFEQRASDIHLEPRSGDAAVRFRIDGILHDIESYPPAVHAAIVSRVKVMARMDIAERRRPQDGRIKTQRGTSEIELRVSSLPTAFGEKIVVRVLDPSILLADLQDLGFAAHERELYEKWITAPSGLILVTGPTGSGKTTTLYSTLKQLATPEVNVCTIEDPIEMIEPAFNQTQVQTAIDMGFAEGVRALMRQDPDIIMVGEIRDLETAEMAIQAALTGHLVFSTLHTNDAASAITRLADLGVPPYLISATVIGVLAQRLARTLCPACKQPDDSDATAMLAEVSKPWRLSGGVRMTKPVGCLECRHTGYRGRVGLYELMVLTPEAREHVHPSYDISALRQQALKDGMRPLRLAGAMKIAEGQTTIDEVLRATPGWSER